MKHLKRTCTILFLSLALWIMSFPQFAFAAEENAVEEIEIEDESLATEPIEVCIDDKTLPDNDELFAGYVDQVFGISGSDEAQITLNDTVTLRTSSSNRRSTLTGLEAKLYDALEEKINGVTAGSITSTVFEIPRTESGDFDQNIILAALMADHPYELFWYDKTKDGGTSIVISNSKYIFQMSVAAEFSASGDPGTYEMNNSAATVHAAAENAKKIVANYSGYSDYDKLIAYKNEICELVDYNEGAASDSEVPYGNPWQLIWVFDENDETDVVCEGYAKAYQYLCDLTEWKDDTKCATMTGYINGGGHMWNVITLDEGNYLADITNTDAGQVGYDGSLFLTGTENGNDTQYSFSASGKRVLYQYDAYCRALYSASERTLSTSDYEPYEKTDISKAVVTLPQAKYIYTGNAILPTPEVYFDGDKLVSGRDYKISYEDNIEVGTATVSVKGIKTYSGTIEKTFLIQFKDVTDSSLFYYEPIYWAVNKNIVAGWEDGTFRPMNGCNRAAVVTFLWRMAGKPNPTKKASFKDMTGNKEFDTAISWASEKGIVQGWSDNTFRPWNTCNRAAIVTFLWRYAGRPSVSSRAGFKDMTGNSDFDKAISWAASKGITTGWDDGTFRPWNTCNRLAIVSFLNRYKK